jgi:hypothetical protein
MKTRFTFQNLNQFCQQCSAHADPDLKVNGHFIPVMDDVKFFAFGNGKPTLMPAYSKSGKAVSSV